MKTTYLVWKDPDCNGANPEWEHLSRSRFLALVKSPAGKDRYFIKLSSINGDGSDNRIVIESTETEYKAWLKEKRHRQYLRDSNPGYELLSYHAMENEDGCYGEELLLDMNCDVEAECFKKLEIDAVKAAVESLSDDERQMLAYFYLSETQGTERGYSDLTGIAPMTVHDRKVRVLKKLKNILKI